jgi:hypothetical protein
MGPLGLSDVSAVEKAIQLSNTLPPPPKGKQWNGSDFYLARTEKGDLELVQKRSLKGFFLALRHRFWWSTATSRLNVGLNWMQATALLKQVADARDETWVKATGKPNVGPLKERVARMVDLLTSMNIHVRSTKTHDVMLTVSAPSRKIHRWVESGKAGIRTPAQEKKIQDEVRQAIATTLKTSPAMTQRLCQFLFHASEKEFLLDDVLDETGDPGRMKTLLTQALWRAIAAEPSAARIDEFKQCIDVLATREISSPHVALREIAQVFGDHFVGGIYGKEEIEGDRSSINYAHLLSKFLGGLGSQDPRIQRMQAMLRNMISLGEARPVSDLQRLVRAQIDNSTTHGCLLAGGWVGHAVSFEIEKQPNGKYTFRVYNKGEGIRYHRSMSPSFIEKTTPCLAVKDIEEETMLSPSVLGMLQSLKSMRKPDPANPAAVETPEPAKVLAAYLLPALGGTPESLPDDVLSAVSPQRSGTCTYMCLDAFVARSLPQDQYRECKFRFRTFLLESYRKDLNEILARGVTDETYDNVQFTVAVVRSSVEHFADRIQKLRADIPPTYLQRAQEEIVQYEHIIAELEQKIDEYEQAKSVRTGIPGVSRQWQTPTEIYPRDAAVVDHPQFNAGGSHFWTEGTHRVLDAIRSLPDCRDMNFPRQFSNALTDVLDIPTDDEFFVAFDELCKKIPTFKDWESVRYSNPEQACEQWREIMTRIASRIEHNSPPQFYLQFLYAGLAFYHAYRQMPNVPQIPLGAFFPDYMRAKIALLTTTNPFWAARLEEFKALARNNPWPGTQFMADNAVPQGADDSHPDDIGVSVWNWVCLPDQENLLKTIQESVRLDRVEQERRIAERLAEIAIRLPQIDEESVQIQQRRDEFIAREGDSSALARQISVLQASQRQAEAEQLRIRYAQDQKQRRSASLPLSAPNYWDVKNALDREVAAFNGQIRQKDEEVRVIQQEIASKTGKRQTIEQYEEGLRRLERERQDLYLEQNGGCRELIMKSSEFWPQEFDDIRHNPQFLGRFLFLASNRSSLPGEPSFFDAKLHQMGAALTCQIPALYIGRELANFFQVYTKFSQAARQAIICRNIFSKETTRANTVALDKMFNRGKDGVEFKPMKGRAEDKSWFTGAADRVSPRDVYYVSCQREPAVSDLHERFISESRRNPEEWSVLQRENAAHPDAFRMAENFNIPVDLASDAYSMLSTPDIQLDTVLDFFKHHYTKLGNNAWLNLFHRVFFTQGALLRALDNDRDRESLIERARAFFTAAIQNAEETDHLDVAANLVWMAQSTERFINHVSNERARAGKANILCPPFVTLDRVRRLMIRLQEPGFESQRSTAFEALLASVQEWTHRDLHQPSDEFATVCVLQWLHKKYAGVPPGHICEPRTTDCEATMHTLVDRMHMHGGDRMCADALVESLKRPACKGLLSILCANIADPLVSIETAFGDSDHLCIRDRGNVVADMYVTSGDFVARNADIAAYTQQVPADIREKLQQSHVLFDAQDEDWAAARGRIEYPPAGGNAIWKIRCRNILFRVSGDRVYVQPPGQDKWFLHIAPEAVDVQPSLLKNRYHCLQREGSLYFADLNTYQIVFEPGPGGYPRMLCETQPPHRVVTVPPASFATFEDPHWTLSMADRAGQILQIDFPRLNISLVRDPASGTFLWKDHPEWRMSLDQHVPHLGQTGALIFEKASGERRVVLPMWDPKEMDEERFPPQYEYDSACDNVTTPQKPSDVKTANTVEFDLKDGELIPKSLRGRYYLARIFAEKGEFERAEKLLFSHEAFATKERLSPDERQILEKMALINASKSIDPRKTRLRVQALFVLRKNDVQFPPPPPEVRSFKTEEERRVAVHEQEEARTKEREEQIRTFEPQVLLLKDYEARKHGLRELDPIDVRFLLDQIKVPPIDGSDDAKALFRQLKGESGEDLSLPRPPQEAEIGQELQVHGFVPPPPLTGIARQNSFKKYIQGRLFHTVPFNVTTVTKAEFDEFYEHIMEDIETHTVDSLIRSGLLPALEYIAFCRSGDANEPLRTTAKYCLLKVRDQLGMQAQRVLRGQSHPALKPTGKVVREVAPLRGELLSLTCLTITPDLMSNDTKCAARATEYLTAIETPQAPSEGGFSEDSLEIAGDKTIRNKFNETSQDIAAARSATIMTCRCQPGRTLRDLTAVLESDLAPATAKMQEMEAAITRTVRLAIEADPATHAQFVAKRRSYPTVTELCMLCAKWNAPEYIKARLPLSDEAVSRLKISTQAYLMQKAYVQQVERSLSQCRSVAEMHADSPEFQVGLARLYKDLSAKRAYAPDEAYAPVFLLIETILNIKLRKDQVDNIKILIEGFISTPPRSNVLQMIMGAGKTSVIQPILSFLLARPEFLSVVDVPEALFEAVKQQLAATVGDSFEQYVYAVDYQRDYIRGEQGLNYLKMFLAKLQEIKSSQACFLRTPRVKHSMITSQYESYYELQEAITRGASEDELRPLRERLKLISDICALTEANERVQIDEIDSTMNSQVIFKYPIGAPKVIDTARGLCLADILIDLADSLKDISIDFIDQYQKNKSRDPAHFHKEAKAFSEEDYARISGAMAARALERLKSATSPNRDGERLYEEARQWYVYYFLIQTLPPQIVQQTPPDKIQEAKLAFLREASAWIKAHTTPENREIIGAAADALTNILKTSLTRKCGAHYGSDPKADRYPARPYSAPHAPKVTMFADAYELVVYSVQKTLYDGIPDAAVKDMIFRLQEKAKREMRSGIQLERTAGYLEFAAIMGDDAQRFRFLEQPPSQQYCDAFKRAASGNRDALHTFFSDYLFPQVKLYEHSVSSTPQTLAGSSAQVCGYTGTLHRGVLHISMDAKPEKGTDGKTILAIERKMQQHQSYTAVCQEEFPTRWVLERFRNEQNLEVFIDSGGWLKDVEMKDFAEDLVRAKRMRTPTVRGVIYHNPEGKIIIRRLRDGSDQFEEIPYEPSAYRPDGTYITIIAQKYETGTNIPQRPIAQAVMTVRKGMTKRDGLQSAFRMRQILEGQGVSFALTKEVKDHIASKVWKGIEYSLQQHTLSEPQIQSLPCPDDVRRGIDGLRRGEALDLKAIKQAFIDSFAVDSKTVWRYMTANEALAEQEKNWTAAKQKMREIVEKPVRMALENTALNEQDRMALFAQLSPLIFQSSEDSPFSKMESGFHPVPADEALTAEAARHMAILTKIRELAEGGNTAAAAAVAYIRQRAGDMGYRRFLEAQLKSCAEPTDIAPLLNVAEKEAEQELQQQAEQQVEQQAEAEQQAEIQQEIQAEVPPHVIFPVQYEAIVPVEGTSVRVDAMFRKPFQPLQSLSPSERIVLPEMESLAYSRNLFPNGRIKDFLNLPARYMVALLDNEVHPPRVRYVLISHEDELLLKRGIGAYAAMWGRPQKDLILMTFDGTRIDSSCSADTARGVLESEEFRRASLLARLFTGDAQFSLQDTQRLRQMLTRRDGTIDEELALHLKNVYEESIKTKPEAAAAYKDGELQPFLNEAMGSLRKQDLAVQRQRLLAQVEADWGHSYGILDKTERDERRCAIIASLIQSPAITQQDLWDFFGRHDIGLLKYFDLQIQGRTLAEVMLTSRRESALTFFRRFTNAKLRTCKTELAALAGNRAERKAKLEEILRLVGRSPFFTLTRPEYEALRRQIRAEIDPQGDIYIGPHWERKEKYFIAGSDLSLEPLF